jgi:hypothetical protein
MALRGRKTLYGKSLPLKEDAIQVLRQLTGQDFGDDAEQWAKWIKVNRKNLYKPKE